MRFNETVAPTEVAVFPLMDKDGLSEKAREVADMLREEGFSVKYDDTGNIGKRYRRQDEVGTPICVTVDYDTLENDPETVTVRDRDSTEQERVKIGKLGNFIRNEF
jgi:glycyl-tRNA synthetase